MATPNTTFSAGAVLTAAQMNDLPFGICGYQEFQTIFTTTGTHTTFQDNGMTLTITEVVNRYYQITAFANPYPSGGQQGVNMRIIRGAAGLKQVNLSTRYMDAGISYPLVLSYVYKATSSGSATYKVQIQAQTANTAVSDYADATFPRQFIITDLGKA